MPALGAVAGISKLAAIALLIFLALVQTKLMVSDALKGSNPQAALAWWPSNSEALLRVAKAGSVDSVSADPLTELGHALLSNSPLAGGGYAALGTVAVAKGDAALAERMHTLAVRRSPRDRVPRLWLIDHAVKQGDFRGALDHLDQVLRISPGRFRELGATVMSLLGSPEARPEVINLLGRDAPPWRESFLRLLAVGESDSSLVNEVFNQLRLADHPLSEVERSYWIQRLLKDLRIAQAHYIWVDALSPDKRALLGNVFDGGFETEPSGSGFGWQIGRIPGATIRRQFELGAGGRHALLIDFQHRHIPFRHVSQLLALPAGTYRMNGRVRLDALQTDRGLRWTVSCPRGGVLAESEPFSGKSSWRSFSFKFEIPAQGCESQQLQLLLPARFKREQWIGGRVWFDDLAIQRAKDNVAPR